MPPVRAAGVTCDRRGARISFRSRSIISERGYILSQLNPPPQPQSVLAYAAPVPGQALFWSAAGRGKWAIGLTILTMATAVVSFWSNWLQLDLLQRYSAGVTVTQAEIASNDGRQMILSLLHLGAMVGSIIAFMMWLHRSYRNLGALPGVFPKWTPAWAVGYFFIPFLNLVRGYQVMRELWTSSAEPDSADARSSVIGWWWGTWILSGIASRVIAITATGSTRAAVDRIHGETVGNMANEVMMIVPGLLIIYIIRRVIQMQATKSSTQPAVATLAQP